MKRIICILLFSLKLQAASAQSQGRQLFFYNVGLNTITAGVGAVMNKQKTQSWKRVFLKGAWQGGIGGMLIFTSKQALHLINSKENYTYAWPAKFLHSAGTSITENAALCEPFLANWHFDLGLVRFDYKKNAEDKFKARLLPWGLYSIHEGFRFGKRFDVQKSVQTGELIFSNPEYVLVDLGNEEWVEGVSFGRAIVIGHEYAGTYEVMVHEIVHQYQYQEYMVFNTWLKPLANRLKSKPVKKLFSRYIYPEVPYFLWSYGLQGTPDPQHYYRNFYEFEAQRFATNKYVPR
ncbi:MAG TPA: hypothetical protein VD794_04185 [Flavisolibacter sp.]|nr:hypothetical protein [Flavisolibacter sp.]